MTIDTLVITKIEQANPILSVEDTSSDGNLAAAQFEAIIRAWKGEAVGQTVPASPVGDADLDGSLSLGQLDTRTSPMMCDDYFISWMLNTWDCRTAPQDFTCPTSPYGNDCITNDILCSMGCDY